MAQEESPLPSSVPPPIQLLQFRWNPLPTRLDLLSKLGHSLLASNDSFSSNETLEFESSERVYFAARTSPSPA